MGVLVALTAGLVFWVSAWALGVKSFDAFLVTVGFLVAAATARMVGPYVKQLTGQQAPE